MQSLAAPVATAHASRAWELLLTTLRSADRLYSPEAARLMGELGRADAVEPLVEYVCSAWDYGKTAGLYALQQLGDAACAQELVSLVDSPNVCEDYYWHHAYLVRAAAALTVRVLDARLSPPFFERQLAEEDSKNFDLFCIFYSPVLVELPPGDPLIGQLRAHALGNIYARQHTRPIHLIRSAKALGRTDTELAFRELEYLLNWPGQYVRGAAAEQLSSDNHRTKAAPMLRDFFEKEEAAFARVKAAGALTRLGDERGPECLRELMLNTPDPLVQANAIDTAAVCLKLEAHELLPLFNHTSPWVRASAVGAMENTPMPDCVEATVTLLDDPDLQVRLQAAKTLLVLSETASS